MSTGQAARFIGVSEDALRARIRAHSDADGRACFDGVEAQRLVRNYRVRLGSRWLPPDGGDERLAR